MRTGEEETKAHKSGGDDLVRAPPPPRRALSHLPLPSTHQQTAVQSQVELTTHPAPPLPRIRARGGLLLRLRRTHHGTDVVEAARAGGSLHRRSSAPFFIRRPERTRTFVATDRRARRAAQREARLLQIRPGSCKLGPRQASLPLKLSHITQFFAENTCP